MTSATLSYAGNIYQSKHSELSYGEALYFLYKNNKKWYNNIKKLLIYNLNNFTIVNITTS